MATQPTDCEAALQQILSLLKQNNATKGFQPSQGVVGPPIVAPAPTLDPQAVIAALTKAASSTTQSTQGKAFAGTTAQAPNDESVSRMMSTILPAIATAVQQEEEYRKTAIPEKGFWGDVWDAVNTTVDYVRQGVGYYQQLRGSLGI